MTDPYLKPLIFHRFFNFVLLKSCLCLSVLYFLNPLTYFIGTPDILKITTLPSEFMAEVPLIIKTNYTSSDRELEEEENGPFPTTYISLS